MDRKAIVKIIAFAILDKYRPGAWKMANTDGRKQALGEAEAVVDALADVGLSIMPTPQSGECSRQPETAPDPQNTADCGEGNDRLGPVTSSDIQEPREYGMCADAEKLNDAAISKLSETPIDTAVGSMPNSVPPSTPGDDSAPAVEGTQWRHWETDPPPIGRHVLASEGPACLYRAVRREEYISAFCGQPVIADPEPDYWLPLDALPASPNE